MGTGLVAEVEDRGLGLSPDELDDINARLASPPEFDLAHSEQLGLFVVSQLAARHDIKVSLRRSVYGGTTAVVLMPFGVVVRQEEAGQRPRRDDRAGRRAVSAALTGRHRLPPSRRCPGRGRGRGRERRWPRIRATAAPWATGPRRDGRGTGTGRHPRHRGTPRRSAGTDAGSVGRPRRPWSGARARGASRPGRRPTGRPVRRTACDPSGAGPASSGSHLGMPIRVPQASLAPQLRARRDADPQEPQDPPEDGT